MAFAKFQENRFRIDRENHAILVNLTASIVKKLDHLTCSKCLFMTLLLYNMYKPINFHPSYSQNCARYMSNSLTFEIERPRSTQNNFEKFSGLLPNV